MSHYTDKITDDPLSLIVDPVGTLVNSGTEQLGLPPVSPTPVVTNAVQKNPELVAAVVDPIGTATNKVVQSAGGPPIDPIPAVVTTALGGKKPDPSPTSTPEPPKTLIDPIEMPSITSFDQRMAKRKAAATALGRKGRASTILSDDSLGGG